MSKTNSYAEKRINDLMFRSIVDGAFQATIDKAVVVDSEDAPPTLDLKTLGGATWVRLVEQLDEAGNVRRWLREHLEAAYKSGWEMREADLASTLAMALGTDKTDLPALLAKAAALARENATFKKKVESEFLDGMKTGVTNAANILKRMQYEKKQKVLQVNLEIEACEQRLKEAKAESAQAYAEMTLFDDVLTEMYKEEACLRSPKEGES